MELLCEKYREKEDSETAVCRRPKEYCKFRSACLIHFLSRQKAGEAKDAAAREGQVVGEVRDEGKVE